MELDEVLMTIIYVRCGSLVEEHVIRYYETLNPCRQAPEYVL